MVKDKEWLESNWWYRLLKVVYIIVGIFAVILLGVIVDSNYVTEEKSLFIEDYIGSVLECKNGKKFEVKPFPNNKKNYISSGDIVRNTQMINDTCIDQAHSSANFDLYITDRAIATDNLGVANFSVIPTKKFNRILLEMVWDYIWSFGLLLFILYVVRGMFFYVACGAWSINKVPLKAVDGDKNNS